MSELLMEEAEMQAILKAMEADPSLPTKSVYRANTELWPNNRMSFVDYHLAYIKAHPSLNPRHYLSNLQLMIRKRT